MTEYEFRFLYGRLIHPDTGLYGSQTSQAEGTTLTEENFNRLKKISIEGFKL